MASLQETLQRLAQGFVARDIMVPLERLTRADDEAAAPHKLDRTHNTILSQCRRRDI